MKLIYLFLILFYIFTQTTYAQTVESLKNDIQQTKKTISSKEKELTKLQKEQNINSQKIGNTKQRINKINNEITYIYKKIEKIQKQLTPTKEKIRNEKQQLQDLLVKIYMLGNDNAIKLLLNSESPDINKRYLQYFHKLNSVKKKHLKNLELLSKEQQNLEKQLEIELEQLHLKKEEYNNNLSLLNDQKISHEKNANILTKDIQKSKKELNQIQRDLKLLISKQHKQIKEQRAKDEKKEITKARKLAIANGENVAKAEASIRNNNKNRLKGLAINKYKLPWPIKGNVIQKYGEHKTGELSWKGLLIKATGAHEIKAIESGDILYSGQLNGYGNIIIIDHGKDYFSLYCNNNNNLVKTGDKIEKGDIIGFVGNSGDLGQNNLYFEIRYKGQPEDPLKYLNKHKHTH